MVAPFLIVAQVVPVADAQAHPAVVPADAVPCIPPGVSPAEALPVAAVPVLASVQVAPEVVRASDNAPAWELQALSLLLGTRHARRVPARTRAVAASNTLRPKKAR